MSKRYTYSKTVDIGTFTAVEFDSFDEAIKAVEKGIYLARIANEAQMKKELAAKVPETADKAAIPGTGQPGPGLLGRMFPGQSNDPRTV